MYKNIRNLSIFLVFPLLLGSSSLEITEENIKNNRDYYKVIGATTGKKIEEKMYAEKRVIETHIATVSAIKEALANNGVDLTTVKVLLYYDSLTIRDSKLPRIWQTKPHPDTIISPWLDLTRTVTTSGKVRITIRIDATIARLLSDLYTKPEDKYKTDNFLSIPTIRESCYRDIFIKRRIALLKLAGYSFPPLGQDYQEAAKESKNSFNCVPEAIREPLISTFRASKPVGSEIAFDAPGYAISDHLFLYCQDEAEEYYSQLYSRLAIRGLQILENKSDPKPTWWNEISESIEPIKECQR